MDCRRLHALKGIEMNAGRELDAKVALLVDGPWDESRCRICGWPLMERPEEGCIPTSCSLRPAPERRADSPAPYSTDLELAFRVIKAAGTGFTLSCDGDQAVWVARFPGMDAPAAAETAPLAICLAALKRAGVEVC